MDEAFPQLYGRAADLRRADIDHDVGQTEGFTTIRIGRRRSTGTSVEVGRADDRVGFLRKAVASALLPGGCLHSIGIAGAPDLADALDRAGFPVTRLTVGNDVGAAGDAGGPLSMLVIGDAGGDAAREGEVGAWLARLDTTQGVLVIVQADAQPGVPGGDSGWPDLPGMPAELQRVSGFGTSLMDRSSGLCLFLRRAPDTLSVRARRFLHREGILTRAGPANLAQPTEAAHRNGSLVPAARPHMPPASALMPYLERIDSAQWYTNFGSLVREFEAKVCRSYGLAAGCAATVANGTTGLALALASLHAPRGALCVVPSWTFCATAHAVVAAGLRPYFVDVDRQTWSLEPEAIDAILADAPGPVAAIMTVAPFGAPIDVTAWDRVTEATGIPVVIDAAASFDGLSPGRSPAVVSLHATKAMAVGEGGVVVSTDPDRIRHIRSLSYFGYDGDRASRFSGANAKMSEYHAAVGLAQFDHWEDTRRRYLALAERYRERLGRLPGVALAPWFGGGIVTNTCNVVLESATAASWSGRLQARGVSTFRWWPEACHTQPAFSRYAWSALPVTEHLDRHMLGIPFHLGLSGRQVSLVLSAVAATVKGCAEGT